MLVTKAMGGRLSLAPHEATVVQNGWVGRCEVLTVSTTFKYICNLSSFAAPCCIKENTSQERSAVFWLFFCFVKKEQGIKERQANQKIQHRGRVYRVADQ